VPRANSASLNSIEKQHCYAAAGRPELSSGRLFLLIRRSKAHDASGEAKHIEQPIKKAARLPEPLFIILCE
jgi:hypothetical protein